MHIDHDKVRTDLFRNFRPFAVQILLMYIKEVDANAAREVTRHAGHQQLLIEFNLTWNFSIVEFGSRINDWISPSS